MTRVNTIILILIFILLILKVYLSYINFPTSFLNSLSRTFIFLCSLGLFLFLKLTKWRKVVFIVGYILLTYSIGYLNLWKASASRFIDKNFNELSAVVNHLNKNFIDCEFKILGNGRWRINIECDSTKLDVGLISNLKNKIGSVEIDKNNELVLISLHRFIDNGYGIAWVSEENIEKIRIESRYRINGLEITSLVKIKDNWYYISFT